MATFIFIIQLWSWFIISRDEIKKTVDGQRFLNSIETPASKFLHWRQITPIFEDLKRLSRLFGIISAVLFAVIFISRIINIQPNILILVSFLIAFLIWTSLLWGTNKRKETLRWFKQLGIIISAPSIFYVFDLLTEQKDGGLLLMLKFSLNNAFGVTNLSDLQVVVLTTVILAIGLIIATTFWFVLNFVVVYGFTSVIWIINRLSVQYLKVQPDRLKFIAYILTPITMILLFII